MSLRDNLKTEKAKERYDRNHNSVESTFTQKELEEHDRNIRNMAIDDFTKALKPIIDEKIKGWTNSDDLRRWCENSIDKVAEQLKG